MACEREKHVSKLISELKLKHHEIECIQDHKEDDANIASDNGFCVVSTIPTNIIVERFDDILLKVSSGTYSSELVCSMFALIHDMKHLMDNRNIAFRLARLCVLCNLFDDAINICNKNNINRNLIFGNAISDVGLESLHFVPHPPVFSYTEGVQFPDIKRGECITFIQKTANMEGVRARKIKPYDTIVIPHEAVKDHLCVIIFKFPEIITGISNKPSGAVIDSVILMISKIQDLEDLEHSIEQVEKNEGLPMNCIYFHSKEDLYRPGIKRFRKRHGKPITITPFHSILMQYFFFIWSFKLVTNKSVQSFVDLYKHNLVEIKDGSKS